MSQVRGGLGAIYVTDTAAGEPNAEELTTIPNAGQNPRGEDDGGEGYDWFHDTVADEVGTTGLGDLEIAEDGESFYVTNLNDRQVYQVPLSGGEGAAPEAGEPTAISLPLDLPGADLACGEGDVRPWAVTEQDGQLYAGLTCTGPTTEDLTSYVYTMDVESGQWADSPVAEFPLGGHARGASLYSDGDFVPVVTADAQPWLEETAIPTELVSAQNGDGYPQLALSNIRIDDRGDMVVGMKDRFGDQSGFQAGGTDPADAELYDGNGAGDVLRLCDAGDGSWEIESNGSCGDLTGDGVDNERGHGGGEFYDASYKPYHDQAALGALLQMPGTDEVLSSHYDPARDSSAPDAAERVQGWRAYSSENGEASRTVTVTEAAERDESPGGGFAKAGGLGELSALVADAPVEIGNRVWLDADGDGIQDAGEAPVEGVTVTLTCGDVTAETTTDENGEYYFNDENVEGGLPASTDCVLTFDATGTDAEGMELSPATAGDNPAIDSDGVAGEADLAEIQATTPAAGADHTFDVGYTDEVAPQECELGDRVWLDENADGIQNDGEPGVPGVTVTLLDENGEPVVDGNGDAVATTTDDEGGYLFEGIDCATYQVQFEDPEDRDFTSPEQGDDPATDSNPNPDTGVTPPVEVTEDDPSDFTVDAGLVPGEEPAPQVCELGDYVWLDENADGIQDDGEPGVPGVTVTLLDENGEPVLDGNGDAVTTVTDDNGGYLFEGIDCATYQVQFEDPEDRDFTSPEQGDDPATDSNPNPETGVTPPVEVTEDDPSDLTVDAGLVPGEEPAPQVCELGDYVWLDENADGIQDDGEPGVPGVIVTLLDENGEPVVDGNGDPVTTTTDDNGGYLFEGIDCATYQVQFEDPEDRDFTTPEQGDDPATDSNPNPDTGITPPVDLTEENPSDPTVDAGLIPGEEPAPQVCTVGDYVWMDENDNGIQDDGEPGVGDVTVTLIDADGNAVDTRTTDEEGAYLFEDIECGTYTVEFSDIPEGTEFTSPEQGDDPATDSNPNPDTGITPPVEVTDEDPEDLTVDAGLVQPVLPAPEQCRIGDYVWFDDNSNGVQDDGESGVPGVTVTLLDENGEPVEGVDPVTTDPAGGYLFDEIDCATYQVQFEDPEDRDFTAPEQGDDPATDSNPNPETGITPPVEVTEENPEDLTVDAGIIPTEPTVCELGDRVWLDENADGIQNDGEPGVPGVTVTLLDENGEPVLDGNGDPVATTTDDNGGYLFEGIDCATYQVQFEDPEDRDFTTPEQGDDPATDSNPNPDTGITPPVELTEDDPSDSTVDAGLIPGEEPAPQVCTVGDYVWLDENADGIQDDGEPGVPGVTVTLLDENGEPVLDGNGDAVTTVTDDNGGYLFEGIDCATYQVQFEDPEDRDFTSPEQGDDPATDSNPNPDTGVTPPVEVTEENSEDLTVDAGIIPTEPTVCELGDRVWLDENADGIQNDGEPGVPGVTVTLLDENGEPVVDGNGDAVTTVTDDEGGYLFEGIDCATYQVQFEDPEDRDFTSPEQGDDPATDSNPNPDTGVTPPVEVTEDDPSDLTVDAGLVPGEEPAPQVCELGDYVWLDENADGIQDDGEPGVPGVTVTLLDENGEPVLDGNGDAVTTVTDDNGGYLFEGIDCATYQVQFEDPEDRDFTTPEQGDDPATDSNPNPDTGITPPVELTEDDPSDSTVDAGLIPGKAAGPQEGSKPDDALAETGFGAGPALLLAAGMIAAGGVTTAAIRRRHI